MSQFSDERGAELRELFFETAQEVLQSLNDEALKIEKRPEDLEAVRSLRRAVHTLKGDAATCGFVELSDLAHQLEDALAVEASVAGMALAEVAFTAADTFASMLTAYRKQTKLPSAKPLRKLISSLAETQTKTDVNKAEHSGALAIWTEYEKLAAQSAQQQEKQVYQISAKIDPRCAMPIAARQILVMALAAIGEVLGSRPEQGSPEDSTHLKILLASKCSPDVVKAKCEIPTVISRVEVRPFDASIEQASRAKRKTSEPSLQAGTGPDSPVKTTSDQPQAQSSGARSPQPLMTPLAVQEEFENDSAFVVSAEERRIASNSHSHSVTAENVLRVDAEKIDAVLNLVGELIIGKSMLQQAVNELAQRYPKELVRGKFADAMAFQSRVLSDLQRSVMKVRMVPVEQLFRRFPRMVRDVAKRCGKQVELAISGQSTDLDKSLLDAIAEPMTHLVRNAVSHGIECKEERKQASKPVHGTIRLNAYHQGSQVVVEVSDDGGGIDPKKIKAKAVKQGVVGAEEAARMTESELLELVFRPGFSTAEEITEISGRGVGLDVVRNVLHRLKGIAEIETRLGQGTTFRLKLPLTLAIIKALLFRVEQRIYAIPLNAVAEIARAKESDLHQVNNFEVLQLRDQVLPVMRLGRAQRNRAGNVGEKIFVLIIAMGERKLGLIVDALEGEEELVIKALDDQTVVTDLVSGASILGDGRVVLIMNLAAIVDRFSKSGQKDERSMTSGLLLSYSERNQNVIPTAVSQ
ncbi:MAG: chemotaxis protein CheA [Terriglobales bacterium]